MKRFLCLLIFLFAPLVLFQDQVRAEESGEGVSPMDQALLKQKMLECPYLKSVVREEDPLVFSRENDWSYANLVKGPRSYLFGYKAETKRDWGEHLPRWSLSVGSMELGLVLATFNGVVKDGKYVLNHVSAISRKCPTPDIHASLSYDGLIEQISIDENCDHFMDKIHNVKIKPGTSQEGEPWFHAASIISDAISKLNSGSW